MDSHVVNEGSNIVITINGVSVVPVPGTPIEDVMKLLNQMQAVKKPAATKKQPMSPPTVKKPSTAAVSPPTVKKPSTATVSPPTVKKPTTTAVAPPTAKKPTTAAVAPPKQGPQPPLCRYGDACLYNKQGQCHFTHQKVAALKKCHYGASCHANAAGKCGFGHSTAVPHC